MNAFRKIRMLSLVLLVALMVVGLAATSAHANGGCYNGSSKYFNTSCYYPTYTNYGNYGFDYSCFTPATYCAPQPYCFPVTMYDCYGRPYVVWQNSYGQTLPVNFGQ
ncbi:MAG: hypothetical protein WD669_06060 [Pirellulales bacterium]